MPEEKRSVHKSKDTDAIYRHVLSKIRRLEASDPSEAKAELALLRRGVGKSLQNVPEVWGMILEDLPENLIGMKEGPSPVEEAIFLSLTLYGLAMQGRDVKNDSAQSEKISLGGAAGLYTKKVGEDNSRILPRFQKVIVSENPAAMSVPLRSVIQLLKQEKINLDFAKLAQDLFYYSFPKSREVVRMRWARDYYRNVRPSKAQENRAETPDAGKKATADN